MAAAFSDIKSRHVRGKKLEKTVWNLLNMYTFVKYHVKVNKKNKILKIHNIILECFSYNIVKELN